MARRPQVKTGLSEVELLEWTRQATTPAECRMRPAVWITTLHGWPAHEVARLLGASKQAIWAWMGPYHRLGSKGLDREGRGGRRWAFLSWEQGERLLTSMRAEALEGRVMTAQHVHARACEAAKREVSLGYACSPELNPVEHVWEHRRENPFGNEVCPTLEDVGERLTQGLRTLMAQPDSVRSLTCFEWFETLRLTSK